MAKMTDIGFITNHAKEIFKKLKENHSGPRSYLVFSSRSGQGGLKSGIDLFSEFPEMFLPETIVQKIADKLKDKERVGKQLTTKTDEAGRKMRELNGKVSEIILRFKAPEVITKQPLKQNNDPPKISENEDKIFD